MVQVGNTPLIQIGSVWAKLECANPCGSIKDRIAKFILEKNERNGTLKPGMKIVEASSGNTGIALTYFAKSKGYDVTIVMPEDMTLERKKIIQDLGANLILCSKEGSFAEAAQIRDEIAQDPSYFNPDQFSNPLNAECHYQTTGQEIFEQLPEEISLGAFVAGVGTGGSLIGVGKSLKEKFSSLTIVAVEPCESAVMSGGSANNHGIGGIGDGFIPKLVQNDEGELHDLIDQVMCVSTEEAHAAAELLNQEQQLCVGVSSGANYVAACRLSKRFGQTLTLFPDGYAKYVSQGLHECKTGTCSHADQCGPLIRQLKEKNLMS